MTERKPGRPRKNDAAPRKHKQKDLFIFDREIYRASFEAKLGSFPEEDRFLIMKAYDYGEKAHGKQKRDEGSPYITHTVDAAGYYIDVGGRETDIVCIILLHDVKEDTPKDVKAEDFNPRIAQGVDVLTKPKLKDVYPHKKKEVRRVAYQQLEFSDWWGFIAAKLSERLHNIRTLSVRSVAKQHDTIDATRESLMPIFEKAINVSSEPEVVQNLVNQLKQSLNDADEALDKKEKEEENGRTAK